MKSRTASLLIPLALASGGAEACSCAAPQQSIEAHVGELFESSEIVGVFEVEGFAYEQGRWALLHSRHLFKGEASELRARAPSRLLGSNCAMRYRRGDLLLVYARDLEPLQLSRCSNSGTLMSRFEHVPFLFDLSQELSGSP